MKLFCKHQYKYYGKSEEPLISGYSLVYYHFICLSCKKEIKIKSTDLREEFEKEGLRILKSIALGDDLGDLNKHEELTLKVYTPDLLTSFRGRNVDVVKRRYMSKGIDLDEIPKAEGWL